MSTTTINALWYEEVDLTAQNVKDFDKSLSDAQTIPTDMLGKVEKVTNAANETLECEIDNASATISVAETTIQAFEDGKNVVKVWTEDKIYSVTVTAATKLIDSQEDFTAIYNNLGGYYKFTGDVEITTGIEVLTETKNLNGTDFTGTIDGAEHKLYGEGYNARLFCRFSGVMENIYLLPTSMNQWGNMISGFVSQGAVVRNVKASAILNYTQIFCDPVNWIVGPASGFFTWGVGVPHGVTVTDCVVNITIPENIAKLSDDSNISQISAIMMANDLKVINNNLIFSNQDIWECTGWSHDGAVRKPAVKTVNDMNVGDTWTLLEGASSYRALTDNVTVEGNVVTATESGIATIEAVYKGLAVIFTANIYTPIANEEDFLKIYENANGCYRLTSNITLTKDMGTKCPGYTNYPYYNFAGILDGNGYTLTVTTDSSLFYTVSGKIQNMKLVSGIGCWGPSIAFILEKDAVIDNVDFDVTFKILYTFRSNDGYACDIAAGIVTINRGVIKNCDVVATVVADDLAQTDPHGSSNCAHGVAYAKENLSAIAVSVTETGSIVNCTATCNMAIQFVVTNSGWGAVTVVTNE